MRLHAGSQMVGEEHSGGSIEHGKMSSHDLALVTARLRYRANL